MSTADYLKAVGAIIAVSSIVAAVLALLLLRDKP
jgi:hypothetical protein